jgi:phosphoribosylformylglycinamidine synthase
MEIANSNKNLNLSNNFYLFINNNCYLSEFRINNLKQQLNVNKLSAYELYLINGDLDQIAINKLSELLNAKIVTNLVIDELNFVVAPRFGTVSPWASKASDIIKRCGLSSITQIERSVFYSCSNKPINYSSLYDQMIETIIFNSNELELLFKSPHNKSFTYIEILTKGIDALVTANQEMGLALSPDEIEYLYNNYKSQQKNLTDIELMMFSQANSEHCRHKIFNADFIINNQPQTKTLFQMIRQTSSNAPDNIIVAYNDNSSIINGFDVSFFAPNHNNNQYQFTPKTQHIIMKVETHNHPTAIEPFAGAATGSGGEIRDEGATGRGAKPKAGMCGFTVSNLKFDQSYSLNDKPPHIKSALDIMITAPIGAASFNNEFGRPNLVGYFRSFEQNVNNIHYGYHKPIMIAGGLGQINSSHVKKMDVTDQALILQIGGPGLLIGLGGGSASSMAGGSNQQQLDYNSVQRSNPEIERRCQEVINTCCALQDKNPILSIHDVGAGGLSNAVPELVHGSNMGGKFELRSIPILDNNMSPLEIWCNESQERYVLAIEPSNLELFTQICQRENCPVAVLGYATKDKQLILNDSEYKNTPIDINIDVLLGKPPRTIKNVSYSPIASNLSLNLDNLNIKEALYKVISHPTVANKSFLITIGDRSVGGLTARDQMVGKWQVPVANCAITASSYENLSGEAMAVGEKTSMASLNPQAASRMAIAESITNICSAKIASLNDIKLSANWMASCGSANQDASLYYAVDATSKLCQELNIAIPVGKDSLSMKMTWQDENKITKNVIAPVSLIITAFAPTANIINQLTPELQQDNNSKIVLLALNNKTRLGASILQECYKVIGGATADVDSATSIKQLFNFIQQYHSNILALHDKSDGGLISTLCEMIFASRIGINLNLNHDNLIEFLFNEEIGVVLQIKNQDFDLMQKEAQKANLEFITLGEINLSNDNLTLHNKAQLIFSEKRIELQQAWSTISHNLQKLRDNPVCADSEFNLISDNNNGLFAKLTFATNDLVKANLNLTRPKIAILREQGVNGHVEMAAAFTLAGFDAVDVHLNDLLLNNLNLSTFQGLAVCGGFSYGDVLGAGRGFANSILYNEKLKQIFSSFFSRNDTFTLGVCNGCQMLAHLSAIIPGANNFPIFTKNMSEQFEARVVMVEVQQSSSILFKDMQGSQLPIIVSHGEGYANFNLATDINNVNIPLRYIDNNGAITTKYPLNPNGSPLGIAGVNNSDGRVTLIMPHPERTFKTFQMSWHEKNWSEMAPWFKIFTNAKDYVS